MKYFRSNNNIGGPGCKISWFVTIWGELFSAEAFFDGIYFIVYGKWCSGEKIRLPVSIKSVAITEPLIKYAFIVQFFARWEFGVNRNIPPKNTNAHTGKWTSAYC